jgi:hypothetical protein
MKAVAELIPQVFFDIMARYVPGLVLFGSWILLLGQDAWPALLNTLVGGHLGEGNALPTATLVLLFVPYVVGYVIAPFAKAVQRGNEHGWWLPPRPSRSVYEEGERKWRPKDWWVASDKAAGDAYDWLRRNAPEAGAFSAKIRAEFTMHNALSVAFLAITVMACIAGEYWWAVASGLAAPLMAYRGATTEKTYQNTTRKLYKAPVKEINPGPPLGPASRLIWLIPEDKRALWEDGKGWLDRRRLPSKEPQSTVRGRTATRAGRCWLSRQDRAERKASRRPEQKPKSSKEQERVDAIAQELWKDPESVDKGTLTKGAGLGGGGHEDQVREEGAPPNRRGVRAETSE